MDDREEFLVGWQVLRAVIVLSLMTLLVWACGQALEYQNRRSPIQAATGPECKLELWLVGECPDWVVKDFPVEEDDCKFTLEPGHQAIFGEPVQIQVPERAPGATKLIVDDLECLYEGGRLVFGCQAGTWKDAVEVTFLGDSGELKTRIRRAARVRGANEE